MKKYMVMLSSAATIKADLDAFLVAVIVILTLMFVAFTGIILYLRYRNRKYYRKRKAGQWYTELISEKESEKRGKKSAQAEVEKPVQAEAKKPAQAEVKKPAQTEVKQPAQAEAKKPAQVEAKKPTQAEVKKPAQAEAKKPTQAEAKNAAQTEVKQPEISVPIERTGEPVISVRNVTMKFKVATSNVSGIKEYFIQLLKKEIAHREFLALNDVSFDIYKGEVVGVIGTNGSGKSTLLRIVSGALRPSSGEVVVDKKKIQLLTLGTGFDMELTAKENVYLNGAIIGYSKEFIDENYDKIVEFAELDGFMEEKVKNFSSGMVSRLGFAIATVGDAAEILILDEVLSVGDEFFRKKSLKRVKEMIHGGSTVLMVSHSMGTILENCSVVVWIEKGVLKMVGEPKEVCAAYQKMRG